MRTSIHPSIPPSLFLRIGAAAGSESSDLAHKQPTTPNLLAPNHQARCLAGYAYLLGMYVIDPPANIVLQDRESASIFYQGNKSAEREGEGAVRVLYNPLSSRDDVVVIRTWRHTRTRSPERASMVSVSANTATGLA